MGEDHGTGGRCSGCGKLPDRMVGHGRLHLWLPLDHTLTKTYRHLRDAGWECETTRDHRVVVRLEGERLSELLPSLPEVLTGTEVEDTRALFKPGAAELELSDIPRVQPLKKLSALGRSGWLLDLLSEERLICHFQPIVRAEEPGEVYAQECLLRGVDTDGCLISPGLIFEAAREGGMLFQTDLAARLAAVREAVRHGVRSNLFVNFTPTSVYDPVFCLRSTIETIDEAEIPHERVVFEVTETEETKDVGHLKNVVDHCRETGFRVALDDIGSGYSSLNTIHQLRPDFIKLDMQLIRGVFNDPYKAVVARKVLEMAQELDVQIIVEGVETEEELDWAREQGANFVQGYLIARPASPPLKDLPQLLISREANNAATRS